MCFFESTSFENVRVEAGGMFEEHTRGDDRPLASGLLALASGTHLPCFFGVPGSHVMQSFDPPPEQVSHEEWHGWHSSRESA